MEKLFQSFNHHPTPNSTTVEGKFPDWLEGGLFRVGPAKWDLEEMTLNHYFDGCALLYKFLIRNGKVEVMSRFLDSDAYNKMITVKRPVFTEFGTRCYPDPCKNVFSRYFSQMVPLDLTDNAVGTLHHINDELYAASESNYLWKVDQETLKGKEKVDLKKLVSVHLATSHPHRCPDGTVYNLGASFLTGLKHHIFKIPPLSIEEKKYSVNSLYERGSILCTISSRKKTSISYCHSFGLTDHFVFFLVSPLFIDTIKMASSGIKGLCIKDCFQWNPQEKTCFHFVDRVSGQELKIKFQSDAVFTFHHVNAYEEEGHVVADIMAYDDIEIFDEYYLERLRLQNFHIKSLAQLTRYVFPLNTGGNVGENLVKLKNTTATAVKQENGVIFLQPECIGDRGFEFPTINYGMFNTRKYKYVYGSGVFNISKYSNTILKLDVTTGKDLLWRGTETMYPSEAVFTSQPGAVEEDDGVLLSVVLDIDPDCPDFLLVLDAKTMQELGRAIVPRDIHLSPTIHGCFIKE